jgi:hypothetical protein
VARCRLEQKAKVHVAVKILDYGKIVPPTFQHTHCHLVFNLKIENFHQKARIIAGGHMMETPATLTYSSVVSQNCIDSGCVEQSGGQGCQH